MAEVRPIGRLTTAAGFVLGRRLDSIPFSAHHAMVIAVLALVGFVEGYDLAITGLLLVMAKAPLHLTEADIRWLAVNRGIPIPPNLRCTFGHSATVAIPCRHAGITSSSLLA